MTRSEKIEQAARALLEALDEEMGHDGWGQPLRAALALPVEDPPRYPATVAGAEQVAAYQRGWRDARALPVEEAPALLCECGHDRGTHTAQPHPFTDCGACRCKKWKAADAGFRRGVEAAAKVADDGTYENPGGLLSPWARGYDVAARNIAGKIRALLPPAPAPGNERNERDMCVHNATATAVSHDTPNAGSRQDGHSDSAPAPATSGIPEAEYAALTKPAPACSVCGGSHGPEQEDRVAPAPACVTCALGGPLDAEGNCWVCAKWWRDNPPPAPAPEES